MEPIDIGWDPSHQPIQAELRRRIADAIRLTQGAELDDILYVLTEQVVCWQATLFKNLNQEQGSKE